MSEDQASSFLELHASNFYLLPPFIALQLSLSMVMKNKTGNLRMRLACECCKLYIQLLLQVVEYRVFFGSYKKFYVSYILFLWKIDT